MNNLQQQASDPDYSVWVSASAGTGKTKILTDRFLRLLIKGVNFQNILCLTFTNAASIEMQLRISNKLKTFSLCNPKQLEQELFLMSGYKPLALELENAKNLYSKLLDNNEPLNIYTIHAFCQKILKTFPVEAGITPEFQILEETQLQDIFLKIRNEIYLSDEHNDLIKTLLNRFHEITLQDIFSEIIDQKIKFKKLFTHKTIPAEIHNKRLALSELNNIYDKVKNLFADYDLEIEPKELFFTKDGKKRKSLLSKELTQKHPKLLLELEKLTSQIYKLDEEYRIEELEYHTNLLCKLAYILLEKYEKFKEENNLLDYDDLIYHTEKLFQNKAIHKWLLHKLESKIDHILVDEAQDTSREQWNIITTLITEFNRADSSIFIVGDDKQSIYSFQGADLANFNLVNEKLQTNLAKANKKYKNITLEYSYRSCSEILQFTHQVFKYIKHYPTLFLSDNPLISAFRTHKGSVTVWSLVTSEKQEELFWALPQDYANALSSADLLIEKIISFIKEKIASKEILPATGNPISEKDFMILVRKRDEFSNNLIKELNKANLKVEASDKVNLKEHLPIMDLISVAKFVLLPYDDLNLAALLKSPIIGISEQQLYELLMNKNDESLWKNLSSHTDIYNKLTSFIGLYQKSTLDNFFDLVVHNLNLYIDDMINELLTLSKNYTNDIDNSLQGFVAWFENNDIWIKRDMEHSDKIRVMTAHGSKGLEAPIVILCDSTTLPISSSKFIWSKNEEMLFSTSAADTPEFLQKMKDAEKLKDLQEYIRLLYVAMTRAKDHLIICGFSNKSNIPENCWYEITKNLFN
ncbi:AAA family ATPase [Rickettsia sp. MEAM1 (Bemisia tabaci)]|uniref:UvrD-helicase domain-containing protein n=1 Tax=unclassified Rickettsia TaxID=114295 RepID=UPI00082B0A44|nr:MULTISPECIES: exodeoxyribonuclease V subunit beta [unclassified Rickettsia]ASX28053.1 AAA family ATPase [Rickettsia sp. MEAM1 (Bemisia tabaci)]ODA37616.1 AAA family ATPase [Rickettsia sp. wq]ODA37965.1 AAA family ATPase [Rickettsia sp. wb]